MKRKVLKVHPADNIIVALTDLKKGETLELEGQSYTLIDDVPQKHKFAAKDFAPNDPVIMYGVLVGRAQEPIRRGGIITVKNLVHAAEEFHGRAGNYTWQKPDVSRFVGRTFNGYHRADGSVGTHNYWIFVPMVFCENRNLMVIKNAFEKELGYAKSDKYYLLSKKLSSLYKQKGSATAVLEAEFDITEVQDKTERLFPNIDGIKFLIHQGGCGGTREDSNTLCALLAGYITHPNVAGATVLSLGCQHAQVEILEKEIKKRDASFNKPLLVFEQQSYSSEEKLLSDAMKKTFAQLIEVNEKSVRRPAPLSKLVFGLECGASDGFSGISANPAMGYAADLLVALGGAVMLSEFPELCGVEQDLINRAVSDEVAEKFIRIQRAYERAAKAVGAGFDMNPSPGNIKDGLITDAIKSAGAAKKGGTSPVTDVLDYTEKLTKPGLNLLCTPGNDVESTTGLAASGAQIIIFSTGLGTPTGNPVAATIKISSNSQLAQRMPDIIDLDCGGIISGDKTIEQVGEEILEFCIRVANGEVLTKAQQLGQDDFIPWKRGVSL
ncbi:MAG: altronate dehydratase family protein [Cytophagales bacterium]|nr:altronate dehydratase family protein [Cytophagales bacterium]MDW8383437.1 altronate dehydratase family protein [Flammeovirgaceae bacterium]